MTDVTPKRQAELPPLHVQVKFGSGIPVSARPAAMMAFEKKLRDLTDHALYIEVFQEAKSDDSKLRSLMTPEQRARL